MDNKMILSKYLRTDNIMMDLVWILPRWMIYWAGIRLWSHATTGKWGDTSPTELTMDEILKRWEIYEQEEIREDTVLS